MQGLEEAVYRNINACRQMTDITKSSFGPNGKCTVACIDSFTFFFRNEQVNCKQLEQTFFD